MLIIIAENKPIVNNIFYNIFQKMIISNVFIVKNIIKDFFKFSQNIYLIAKSTKIIFTKTEFVLLDEVKLYIIKAQYNGGEK